MNKNFYPDLRWELREVRQALASARFYRTLAATAVGVTLFSVALNGVVIPANLFAPGVSGLALVWYYLVGWPSVGLVYLILNIPLFLLGWREYTLKFTLLALAGVGMFTLALEWSSEVRIPVNDPMLAALLAGVLTGGGSGLYLRFGGSAGGLDILGAYLKKKFSIPIGTIFISINGGLLVAALVIHDFEFNLALYSAVFMWVNSWVLERVLTGFSGRNAVLIFSKKPDKVAEEVMHRLDRGVSFFHASGGSLGAQERVIYTVINLFELGKLKDLLFQVDPEAFVVVYNTSEVIGERFLSWEDQGYLRRPPLLGETQEG